MSIYNLIWDRWGDPEAFMRTLRSQAASHGLTQADIARRSGYEKQEVNRWWQGGVTPSLETRLKLSEALDQLISGEA